MPLQSTYERNTLKLTEAKCWNEFCSQLKCDGISHKDSTGFEWIETVYENEVESQRNRVTPMTQSANVRARAWDEGVHAIIELPLRVINQFSATWVSCIRCEWKRKLILDEYNHGQNGVEIEKAVSHALYHLYLNNSTEKNDNR